MWAKVWPLRSRAHPFGLPSLSASEAIVFFVQTKFWRCYVTSEDLGGRQVSGQASPWDLEEFHSLQGVNEAARGAAFLCRFVTADQKHPEGIVTHFPSILKDLYLGWPELRLSGDLLVYFGPLPRDCPSSQTLGPMRGLTDGTFNSSSAHFFSVVWRARIFGAIAEVSNPLPLGMGSIHRLRVLRLRRLLCRCLRVLFSCLLRVRFNSFSWLGLRAL